MGKTPKIKTPKYPNPNHSTLFSVKKLNFLNCVLPLGGCVLSAIAEKKAMLLPTSYPTDNKNKEWGYSANISISTVAAIVLKLYIRPLHDYLVTRHLNLFAQNIYRDMDIHEGRHMISMKCTKGSCLF